MAYETFAFVYDEVMDESLYQKWLDFSNRHLPQGTQQILEMACGTGALAVDFAKSGYDVTALDLSEEMLMIASERAFEEEVPVQFVQGNMLDLSEVGQYQAITCFSDSLDDHQFWKRLLGKAPNLEAVLNRLIMQSHSSLFPLSRLKDNVTF